MRINEPGRFVQGLPGFDCIRVVVERLPFVIDRKNFLFANTPKGATGSAIMFSLIQTAIENGLDPYRYLTWLLRTANTADLTDAQAVQNLLPWKIPAECHVK